MKIGRRAWSTRDYCGKSQKRLLCLHVKAGWIFASEISLNSNFKRAAHEHDLLHMRFKKIELELAIIWKEATCQRITSKKTLKLSGWKPQPAIRSGDTGQQIHYFDSCQLIKTWMYNIRLQAPKLARKCEIKHWYACGADRRKVGWSVYGHVIAKFSRMDRF